jgi:hypothetical protein
VRRLVLIFVLALSAGTAAAQQQGDLTPQRDTSREHEILSDRPSGFWTSNRPTSQRYRWRLLGIGCGLLVVTGLVTLRIVRRASRARDAARPPTAL